MNKKTGGGKILNEIAMRVFEIHTIYPMYYVIRMVFLHKMSSFDYVRN